MHSSIHRGKFWRAAVEAQEFSAYLETICTYGELTASITGTHRWFFDSCTEYVYLETVKCCDLDWSQTRLESTWKRFLGKRLGHWSLNHPHELNCCSCERHQIHVDILRFPKAKKGYPNRLGPLPRRHSASSNRPELAYQQFTLMDIRAASLSSAPRRCSHR